MSRIGKLPVAIPQGVTVTKQDNVVTVKGPKGTLTQEVRPQISVEIKDNEVQDGNKNNIPIAQTKKLSRKKKKKASKRK